MLLFLLIFTCIGLTSCTSSRPTRKGVVAAMHHYDELILHLNADSIAMLYMPDGNLGDIAIGRDSIRKFLSSFKNVQVLSQVSTTDSLSIQKNIALQKGHYTQSDIVSGKDTIHVKGSYTATWQWNKKDGWLIKKMSTKNNG